MFMSFSNAWGKVCLGVSMKRTGRSLPVSLAVSRKIPVCLWERGAGILDGQWLYADSKVQSRDGIEPLSGKSLINPN
jgi:hypothetical protein